MEFAAILVLSIVALTRAAYAYYWHSPAPAVPHLSGAIQRSTIRVGERERSYLEAHQLAPHRIRMFKLSTDPKFADKLKDVAGLYVDPPAHAVVLSVDEKSQCLAA
jgi:hypothetical protein